MPGVELITSACDGHDVVALRGEVDAADVAEAEAVLAAPQWGARRLLTLTGHDGAFCVQASVEAAVAGMARRRRRYPWRRLAVRTARLGRAAPSRTGTG
jgi:hypothetical protein